MAAPIPVQQNRWDSFQETRELRIRRAWLARFSAALARLPFVSERPTPAVPLHNEMPIGTVAPYRPIVWSTQPVVHEQPVVTGWWRFDARHETFDGAEPEVPKPMAHFSARTAYNPFMSPSPRLSRRG